MRHLTFWLALLVLGGVPFAAAAADYGVSPPLLAAEDAASSPTEAPAGPAAMGEMAKPDTGAADSDAGDGDVSEPPAVAARRPIPAQPTAPLRPRERHGMTQRGKAHPAPDHPIAPPTATWQSLLPGSIQ